MTNPPGNTPNDRNRDPSEPALGGADAVEKTSYVVGAGTEPERMRAESPGARKGRGASVSTSWAVVIFLAVGAVLVYVLGWGR
jgi:hypothetical protein